MPHSIESIENHEVVNTSPVQEETQPACDGDVLTCVYMTLLETMEAQTEKGKVYITNINSCIEAQSKSNERLDQLNFEVVTKSLQQWTEEVYQHLRETFPAICSDESLREMARNEALEIFIDQGPQAEIANQAIVKQRDMETTYVTLNQQAENVTLALFQATTNDKAQTSSMAEAMSDTLRSGTDDIASISRH